MKEKRKEKKPTDGGGGGSIFDGASLPENKNVSVSCGPYAEDLPVAGMSVGEVRKRFSDRFDIDDAAQSIINGKPVGDEVILKATDSLMFVKHAGEKGARVVLEGNLATTDAGTSMAIGELLARCGPGLSTGGVLPNRVKAVISEGCLTIWVYEVPPHIARLRWIRADSPRPYGSGTTYRNVRIALPYLVLLSVFGRDENGMPGLLCRDEAFFRNAPLESLDDELFYPALLNCSKYASPDSPGPGHPLSWICTQHLKETDKMASSDPMERFQAGMEAVRYCLLETGFNLSSEHHEGSSWFGYSKTVIPELITVEEWEKRTIKDPLFVLNVNWVPTKHTVRQVAARIFKTHGGGGGVKNANDIARLINNKS